MRKKNEIYYINYEGKRIDTFWESGFDTDEELSQKFYKMIKFKLKNNESMLKTLYKEVYSKTNNISHTQLYNNELNKFLPDIIKNFEKLLLQNKYEYNDLKEEYDTIRNKKYKLEKENNRLNNKLKYGKLQKTFKVQISGWFLDGERQIEHNYNEGLRVIRWEWCNDGLYRDIYLKCLDTNYDERTFFTGCGMFQITDLIIDEVIYIKDCEHSDTLQKMFDEMEENV